MGSILLVAGLAMAAAGAPAASAPIVNPDWEPLPPSVDLSRYFPARALNLAVDGWARLRCKADEDGLARDCIVVGEYPFGFDFGTAALKIAAIRKLQPITRGGEAVAGRTIIATMRFSNSDGGGGSPSWPKEPTRAEIDAVHPAGAEGHGTAAVACLKVAVDGALQGCHVMEESPPGEGFGAAAVSLAGSYRAYPGRQVPKPRFRVEWRPDGEVSYLTMSGDNFDRSPTIAQVEAPPTLGGDEDSVLVTCEATETGDLAHCVAETTGSNGPARKRAALALAPLYHYSQAIYRVNWTPPAPAKMP